MTTATLTEAPSLTCPACLDQVEFLFSTTGVCLDCEIDLYNHTVTEYEEREAEGETTAAKIALRVLQTELSALKAAARLLGGGE